MERGTHRGLPGEGSAMLPRVTRKAAEPGGKARSGRKQSLFAFSLGKTRLGRGSSSGLVSRITPMGSGLKVASSLVSGPSGQGNHDLVCELYKGGAGVGTKHQSVCLYNEPVLTDKSFIMSRNQLALGRAASP